LHLLEGALAVVVELVQAASPLGSETGAVMGVEKLAASKLQPLWGKGAGKREWFGKGTLTASAPPPDSGVGALGLKKLLRMLSRSLVV
jgi:hypothetical protein